VLVADQRMSEPRSRSAGVTEEQLRLMAVHAHPDDESSKGAATMARYVDEGVDVLVVTATGGERGSILNPAMDRLEVLEHMPEIRKAEMAKAREILGVRQEWLGFVDSGLPEGDPLPPLPEGSFGLVDVDEAAGRLVAAIRRQRPHVVITYDENGGYPHPDHIMTHKISVAAFDAAGDPDRYPDAGEPWQPLKLYYHMSFGRARIAQMHEALLAAGLESPYEEWLEEWDGEDTVTPRITTRVECAEWFPRRDEALLAHATQIDPTSRWFAVPLQLRQQINSTEDYELARSLVDTDLPEDDLFAGVRETINA
jgi:mycothiol S-conjugate amidase